MASNSSAADAVATNEDLVRIVPSRGWVSLQLHEVWQYHELLYFLVWRDIKVRYKQTVLGGAWAIIQPLMSMVIFTVIFGKLAKIPSDGVPYPIFSYTALVPWSFFASGLGGAANSLVGSSNLIKKVYFPRLVIPIATVLSGIVDFALAFAVLLVMMLYYRIMPTVNIVWLPLFLLLALTTALGVGLWLSALNVQYRDVRQIVGYITQFWMYATPIVWSSTMLPGIWRTLYGINPMAGVVEGFRWALLGGYRAAGAEGAKQAMHAPGAMVWVSACVSLVILVSGAYYFRRMEKTFADLV
jgi:lipopolysaccharide transport system permease protein